MPEILHDFPIAAPRRIVFDAVSTPAGLDPWWTLSSRGVPAVGNEYVPHFGPPYDWRAEVTRCVLGEAFELESGSSDADWSGTRVGFELSDGESPTQLRFHHRGWPQVNEHYRTSTFCWAMYLRVLRGYLEHGERVPYEQRLSV